MKTTTAPLPMNLRRIRHFVVLAETLNFRRAAERLNMAQPPLSVSIHKLEAELGVRLFERISSGVTLSVAGASLLPEARRLLAQGAELTRLARGAADGTGGQLRIGFAGSAIYELLPMLLPRFRAQYPDVELVLREATSASIMRGIDEETHDIGLVRTPLLDSTRAKLVTLQRETFIAALPAGNPLASRAGLVLADLAGEPFILYSASDAAGLRCAVLIACQQAGFIPRVSQEAVQIQTVLALVESGLGVALVPSVMQRFSSERIVYCTLHDLPPAATTALALAYLADSRSPSAKHFLEFATRTFKA